MKHIVITNRLKSLEGAVKNMEGLVKKVKGDVEDAIRSDEALRKAVQTGATCQPTPVPALLDVLNCLPEDIDGLGERIEQARRALHEMLF